MVRPTQRRATVPIHRCSLWVSILSTPLLSLRTRDPLRGRARHAAGLPGRALAQTWRSALFWVFNPWFGIHYAHLLHENVFGFEALTRWSRSSGSATPVEWVFGSKLLSWHRCSRTDIRAVALARERPFGAGLAIAGFALPGSTQETLLSRPADLPLFRPSGHTIRETARLAVASHCGIRYYSLRCMSGRGQRRSRSFSYRSAWAGWRSGHAA